MSDLYGLLFRNILHPGWESGLRRRPTLSHLRQLRRSEWFALDELEALQTTALRRLLEHAHAHSPYYRRTFRERGLDPGDVRSLDDLRKLPLLTRREASLYDRKSSVDPLPLIGKMTSGSTGNPLAFAYDVGSEHWRQATKLRGYGWARYRPGDRTLHFWGSTAGVKPPPLEQRVKIAIDRHLRREHYVDCADHSEEALADVVRQIRELRPAVIVCYARAGASLARHVVETRSRDWPDIVVIAAAEKLFPADRAVLAEAFGPSVFESYGSREFMLMAAECECHQGLHLSMENLLVEVIVRDQDGERPAAPGEVGEVVVTDLHNYGAPFIRYVNGDLAVLAPRTRCACGRALRRLECVEGRESDTLRDGHGRPVGGLYFSVIFSALADAVRGFQVVQRKDRSIDLKLVPGARFDDAVLERVRRDCARAIPGVELRTHVVPDIPAEPTGKRRVVRVEADSS